MGQSEGEKGQEGRPSGSSVPEGAAAPAGPAGAAAQYARVRAVRDKPAPPTPLVAPARPLEMSPLVALDLLLEMDEPGLLVRELEQAACIRRSRSPHWAEWDAIIEFSKKCQARLDTLSQPAIDP